MAIEAKAATENAPPHSATRPKSSSMNVPSRLSDRELQAEVLRLATCERRATASLVAHLSELYGRRLHERAGFSSLFTYCMEVLGLSEHEAARTSSAVRPCGR